MKKITIIITLDSYIIALKGAINGGYIGVGETKYEPIKIKKIVVPSEIDGVKVTTIGIKYVNGNRFFYKGFGNPYVEEIVLPDTIVKFIGPSLYELECSHTEVFQGCDDIVVTVKSGTSLTADNLKAAGVKEENIHFE